MNKKLVASVSVVALLIVGFFVYQNVTAVKSKEVNLSAQQEKITEYANPKALITAEALKELLDENKEDVVVIGTMESKEAIPDSFVVWRPDYSGTEAFDYDGMANTKEEMEKLLSDFGVKEDTTIVTYAGNDQHDSARVFWQLKMLGHDDVRMLDGGMPVWLGAGYETAEPAKIGDRETTDYKAPDYNPDAFNASLELVTKAVDNDDYIIIDTRGEDEETGSDTKKGAFGPGKIKGAKWLQYSAATTEEGTFKSKEELEEIYKEYTDSGKQLIPYCQSGVRSAYTWFVLTQILGYEDALNYDGSWIEWSYQAYEKGNQDIIDRTENGEF
ncbi:sulfurtransferase [Bacillus marinisedimentorum]|uniref:sulfurtransferase n=1 Tax=Bacillus marinisedimentorum TaxID=1821260 RepID=UPI00087311BE|nr:rhodanese-like domain-containing protein [Bacillus marinisedimentorum]